MRLAIIGGGRAAWAFGSAWQRIGWPIAGVATRRDGALPRLLGIDRRPIEEMLDAELILIAVSDRAIHEVAASIPPTNAIIWHPSGSHTSVRGGFSLHPLKALPPVGEPSSDIAGTLLVFEGEHRDVAKRIADAAGARFAEISAEQKPSYHAAAVFASNYVAALLDIAHELIGIDNVRDDLAALAQSAIENWAKHTDARRFTGPAARGDRAVIDTHIEMLQPQEDLAVIYRLLAERILASAK